MRYLRRLTRADAPGGTKQGRRQGGIPINAGKGAKGHGEWQAHKAIKAKSPHEAPLGGAGAEPGRGKGGKRGREAVEQRGKLYDE